MIKAPHSEMAKNALDMLKQSIVERLGALPDRNQNFFKLMYGWACSQIEATEKNPSKPKN